MVTTTALAVGIAVYAGVAGAVQPKINAVLGARVGSPLVAALVNFAAAFSVVLVALAVRPSTRTTLRSIASWRVPKWTYTAGLGGALVVAAGAFTVQTLGVAIFSVAFFGGQIVSGLFVDRFGISGGERRFIVATRVQAALLAIVAVVMAQLGRPLGELAPPMVAFVLVAGAGVAFQSAFNGRIVNDVRDPVAATAVNVSVGLTALAILVSLLAATGGFGPLQWPTEAWLYFGGVLGVTIVLSLAVATAALGVLRATLTMLASQLTAAFAVDWVVEGDPPGLATLVGAVLIMVAVALVRGRRSV